MQRIRKRIKIGVDIDGVLANSGFTIIEKVNELHGLELSQDMIKDYWYNNEEIKHAKDLINQTWRNSHEGEILVGSPLISNAQLFNMLPGDVELITHRDKNNMVATYKWLYKHDLYNYNNLIFAVGPKSQYGPWDYFVEDCMDNVHDLQHHVTKNIFVINHPYNINIDAPDKAIRVDSWEEIIDFFKKELIRGI
jgi:uncharacterized HAD superfamily protein